MAQRIITHDGPAGCRYKVYWDSEFREYVTKLFIEGKHYEPSDYFTNDKQDAINTGIAMMRRAWAERDQ
jgi:hypothetical protein